MEDPMRKEVAMVRKKIDLANKDVKQLGQNYQKKVRQPYYFLLNNIKTMYHASSILP